MSLVLYIKVAVEQNRIGVTKYYRSANVIPTELAKDVRAKPRLVVQPPLRVNDKEDCAPDEHLDLFAAFIVIHARKDIRFFRPVHRAINSRLRDDYVRVREPEITQSLTTRSLCQYRENFRDDGFPRPLAPGCFSRVAIKLAECIEPCSFDSHIGELQIDARYA